MAKVSEKKSPGLRFDVVAGLTAAAVVLPKAMAYATVAGLPVAVNLGCHSTRRIEVEL